MPADSPQSYGTVTRALHWLIALCLVWMLFTASLHAINEESAIVKMLFPYHPQMGVTLLILGLLRISWLWMTRHRRPQSLNTWARAGHWALYLLVIVIPIIGLGRQFGSGRPFNYLGLQLMQQTEDKVAWLVDFGHMVHGELGWFLFALVAGHIIMAFWHRRGVHAHVFTRMVRSPRN